MSKKTRLIDYLNSLLAASVFALPTTVLIWFATNKHLALWVGPNAFISTNVFWAILFIFLFIAVVFPNLFPRLLGFVWQWLIKMHNWFG